MSLAGKFSDTLDGQGAHSGAHVHVDSVSTHAPPGAIIVPDAHLLFTGDFKRSGVDLVLTGDDRELVLHDYFKGEKRAALASPDGAHLTGDIVNALTGHTQMAQADGSASVAQVIGHVTKLAGTATAIRNGVSIILNNGDNVNKGDVVQSGSDSTLGITFIDGSVFGLGSNAKMVLNEMVYDPNGSNNSSLLSLVQGTISFVAGATAKKGDMKVDTPVATMGIRGTAVLVEIDFVVPGQGGAPPAKFQVLVEPDGTTGSYILFDKTTLTPIATVNQAGTQTIVNGQGTVNFLSSVQLSPDAQKIITDVFALKFSDLNNPQSKTHFTDIGVPEIITIKLASGQDVPVELKTVQVTANTGPSTGGPTGKSGDHIPGPPGAAVSSAAFTEHGGVTGSSAPDTVTGQIEYTDLNAGDRPTAKAIFASFAYQNAQHADVTSSLTAKQLAAIQAVEVPIVVVQDPALINNGTATWTYSVADGAFDFLAAGETLTLTYIAQVDNNFELNNETSFRTFTVTITGTNDVPVITTGAQHIAFVGGKTTPGGPLTTSDAKSGTLSFTDVDLTDTHTVSTKLTSALLAGAGISQLAPAPLKIFETALSASIAANNDSTDKNTGTINWQLADLAAYLADFIPAGQTLSLVYTVTVTDSQGATSSQNIVVDITGNNTPALVWIATAENGAPSGGLWSDTANWETGTVPTVNDDAIIITDQLRGLTPSYPVTIASAATAKSLTMDDFGTLFTNSPTLINNSTLTIGAGGIHLGADSVFRNTGTVQTAGLMEVLNQSTLQNSGAIYLAQGGDFNDQSVITNSGTIEVASGILNIEVNVANTGGTLAVDGSATMTLDGATITGGNIINDGLVEITGDSSLYSVAVSNSWLTVDATRTLTLNGATITGGTVTNDGTIHVTGNSAINGASLLNTQSTVDSGTTLTLDDTTVAGGTITNNGTVKVDALKTLFVQGVTLSGGAISNAGTVAITASSSIENDIFSNALLTVYDGETLTLAGTTVTGGTIDNFNGVVGGAIQITSDSAINGALLNKGQLTVDATKTLTLDDTTITGTSITDNGTIKVDGTKTLKFNGVALDGGAISNLGTIEITGSGSITNDALANNQLTVDATKTLTLNGTTVTGGVITNTGATLAVAATKTVTLDNVIVNGGSITDNGTVHVDTARTLTLNGVTVNGGHLTNDGTIDTTATTVLNGVGVDNAGTIEATSGVLKITGSVVGDGSIQVDAGAFLELNATVAATQKIVFDGAGSSEVQLDASTFGGQIQGMAATDELDLRTIGYGLNTTGTYVGDASGGVLTITDGVHSISMTLVGDYRHAHFAGASDGNGGTLVTLNADDDKPTFAAGETLQSGAFSELSDTTGSSTSNPAPALTGSVHFADIDLVDRPTATITSQSVTWTDGGTDLSGSLSQSQIDALDHALLLQQLGNTNNGAIGWTYAIADHALDFLADGQTATVTSTITLDDHEGRTDTATATVTITVTGANDAPVVTSGAAAAQVSEEGLTNGVADTQPVGLDTTNSTSASGTITATDVDGDALTMSLGTPIASMTSGGVAIGWTLQDDGHTLIGKAGTATIITATITDVGTYNVALSGPIDHSTANQEDSATFAVPVIVSDGHTTTPTTLSVTIEDDSPTAGPVDVSIVLPDSRTNVMLVLDLSGSMDTSSGLPGLTRLDVAKAAINELLDQYDNRGDVMVRIVTFSDTGAAVGSGWQSVVDAKAAITGLSAGGGTNYDAALLTAMQAFTDGAKLSGPGTQNVSYFLSDGDPAGSSDWPQIPGTQLADGIQANERAVWDSFLTTNKIVSFGLGIPTVGTLANLAPIAFDPASGAQPADTPIIVTDPGQLANTLVFTIPPVTGGVLVGDLGATPNSFGADGGFVRSITVDGVTYTFNPAVNGGAGGITASGGGSFTYDGTTKTLTLDTDANVPGGELGMVMTTGAFTFQPSTGLSSKSVDFVLADRDGDTASSTVHFSVAAGPDHAPIVRDDHVITNISGGGANIVIPDYALLYNDSDADGQTIAIPGAITNVLGATSVTHASGNVTFTDNNTNGGSFTYAGSTTSPGASDTGDVIIDRRQAGTTLTGTGFGDILIGRDGSNNTINANQGNDVLIGGTGNDSLSGGAGADMMTGGGGVDTFIINSGQSPGTIGGSGDAGTISGYDVIIDFAAATDILNLQGTAAAAAGTNVDGTDSLLTINGQTIKSHTISSGIIAFDDANTFGSPQTLSSTADVAAVVDYLHRNDLGDAGATVAFVANIGGTAHTYVFEQVGNSPNAANDILVDLAGVTLSNLTALIPSHILPAGVSGSPINLGLTDPADHVGSVTVEIAGVPSGWTLSEGTNNGAGGWTIRDSSVSMLSIASSAGYTGAMALQVTMTWINADGSSGFARAIDNVEVFAQGAPIFAWSGEDHLTGSSGKDLFVFAQPIGHDTIYSFDAAHDQLDLIGYASFTGFADIEAHLADDANGDAVITLGDGQSIELHGVHAAALTANNFDFDQTPTVDNAATMTIGDGAMLPLSGTIVNTGTIALNSTGDETDLQLIGHGVTLEGGGKILLSDSDANIISGTSSGVTLNNEDNTISGAGHLGNGELTLINAGIIDATGTHALTIDTGLNPVTNSGVLEASGSGGMIVSSDIENSGELWANGATLTIHGAVSGNGTATIDGSGTLDFEASTTANVVFGSGTGGTLKLGDSFHFNGTISGFGGADLIDLANVAADNASISYHENTAGTGGTLAISAGAQTLELSVLGHYSADNFSIVPDRLHGTSIAYVSHDLML